MIKEENTTIMIIKCNTTGSVLKCCINYIDVIVSVKYISGLYNKVSML